jgi:hypothetical protein
MEPVRFSHLKAYGRSPMHGHAARLRETKPTAAMQLGTAVHALVFNTRKVIGYPGATRRGKEYDAFVTANPDSEILSGTDFDKARRMSDAVRESKVAAPYLIGTCEKTILFKWMGLDCRATPDCRGDTFITELKTSASSDPARFLWHARKMAYHAQLRFQEYALADSTRDAWIVCVESDDPHPVTVFHLEPEAREEGEKLLTLWGERLKSCEAAGQFPPYVQTTVPLVWPKDDELIFGDEE